MKRRRLRRCNARTRGFTLIELLVVLVVFSLLALMSYRGLNAVLDTRSHVKQETEKWHRMTAFFSRFDQDVHLAAPRPVRNTSDLGGTLPAWLGDPSRYGGNYLEFSRFGSMDGGDSAQRIAYTLSNDKQIELWLWPSLDNGPASIPERHAVLTGVAVFELKYMDDNQVWQLAWPVSGDVNSLPRAVQMRIVLLSGEEITRVFAL